MASSDDDVGVEQRDKYLSLLVLLTSKWRFSEPPNYHVVKKLFEGGGTKEKLQNLVKNWGTEFFHKACIEDSKTIDPNNYTFILNALTIEEIGKLSGGYNPLPQTSWERRGQLDHQLLFTSSGIGVTWRVLLNFKGHAPTGKLVEFFATAILEADEEKKIVKVGFFYDRGEMLGGLPKGTKIDCSASAEAASSNCPVLGNTG